MLVKDSFKTQTPPNYDSNRQKHFIQPTPSSDKRYTSLTPKRQVYQNPQNFSQRHGSISRKINIPIYINSSLLKSMSQNKVYDSINRELVPENLDINLQIRIVNGQTDITTKPLNYGDGHKFENHNLQTKILSRQLFSSRQKQLFPEKNNGQLNPCTFSFCSPQNSYKRQEAHSISYKPINCIHTPQNFLLNRNTQIPVAINNRKTQELVNSKLDNREAINNKSIVYETNKKKSFIQSQKDYQKTPTKLVNITFQHPDLAKTIQRPNRQCANAVTPRKIAFNSDKQRGSFSSQLRNSKKTPSLKQLIPQTKDKQYQNYNENKAVLENSRLSSNMNSFSIIMGADTANMIQNIKSKQDLRGSSNIKIYQTLPQRKQQSELIINSVKQQLSSELHQKIFLAQYKIANQKKSEIKKDKQSISSSGHKLNQANKSNEQKQILDTSNLKKNIIKDNNSTKEKKAVLKTSKNSYLPFFGCCQEEQSNASMNLDQPQKQSLMQNVQILKYVYKPEKSQKNQSQHDKQLQNLIRKHQQFLNSSVNESASSINDMKRKQQQGFFSFKKESVRLSKNFPIIYQNEYQNMQANQNQRIYQNKKQFNGHLSRNKSSSSRKSNASSSKRKIPVNILANQSEQI